MLVVLDAAIAKRRRLDRSSAHRTGNAEAALRRKPLSALSDERVDSRGNLAGQILLDHGDRLPADKILQF